MKKSFARWIKILLIIYCSAGIALYYLQDTLFFHPEPLEKDHVYNFDQPFRELNIPYTASSSMNIIQFTTVESKPKGVVLYFHGNKANNARYAPFASTFTAENYEVWMIDYPGFGKSTGEFSEAMLYNWALTFYKLARARFEPEEIILYGKSLGTGIAAQLASVRDCKYLVLETPYYSLPSIIDSYLPVYPTGTIIRYSFPTYKYLDEVTAPIAIFHGSDDRTIPLRNARRLEPALKTGDEFIVIEDAGHNSIPENDIYKSWMKDMLNNF